MKQAWHRLGSPDAISWVMVLLVSVQQIAGSLTGPFVYITGRVGEFLLIRIIALLAMFAVLGLGKLALLRFARQRPKPWLTLAIFALTTLTGIISINAMLIQANFTERWTIPERLLVALPGIFSILILSALLVSFARDHARRNAELAVTAEELVLATTESANRIEQKRLVLVEEVREEIQSALGALDETTTTSSSDDLKSLIDDVVRPMSYQLSSGAVQSKPDRLGITDPKISWSAVIETSLRINPAHPLATSVWLSALICVYLLTSRGLMGLVGAAALFALTFGVLALTRLLWRYVPISLPVWARTTVFSVALILISLLSAPVMTTLTGYDFTAGHAFIGWIILSMFMMWTVTLVFGVNASLRETSQQLEDAVDSLRRKNIHLNNELRALQKGVARVLHGPIQEAIAASIHRLHSRSERQSRGEIVADMQARIFAALQTLTEPQEIRIDFDATLRDLAELWDEVVDIQCTIHVDAREAMLHDPACASALVELIREGCNNAIRHGSATHIDIRVSLAAHAREIALEVANDGNPLAPNSRRGLGSQIFDERCLSWSREQNGALVRLEARIPLNQEAEARKA